MPASLVIRECAQISAFGKQFALILSLSSNGFCLLPEIEGYCYSFSLNFQSVRRIWSSIGCIVYSIHTCTTQKLLIECDLQL